MDNVKPRRPILFLPFWVWVLVVTAVVVTLLQTQMGDQGMANGFTWPTLVLAGILIVIWFCFFSGVSRKVRLRVLFFAILLAGLFPVFVRVEGVTGNIIPILSWRWTPPPVQREPERPKLADTVQPVDLATTTPNDFPHFLGPKRDLSVAGVTLDRDWGKHPPKEVWRQKIGAGWSGFSVVNGFAVTLEQRGPTEMITCYEAATGKLRWAYGHEARFETFVAGIGPRSTPTIHEGKVYALGATGVLFCLDGADGKLIWKKDLVTEFGATPENEAAYVAHGRANSPLIVDDVVVIPAGGKPGGWTTLAAYQKDTGELVWQAGTHNVSYASPALATLASVRQILIVNEDCVSGHDASTGKQLWEIPWPGTTSKDANVSQAVPIPPDRVLVSKGYGGGSILLQLIPKDDGLETKTLWRKPQHLKTKLTNVTIHNGHVYALSDGILECVELETGKRVWREGRYGHGQILRVHDLLLVLSEEGELNLVEASPATPNNVLGTIPVLEGRTWNNLALYGDLLLMRNAREAVCYRLTLATPH